MVRCEGGWPYELDDGRLCHMSDDFQSWLDVALHALIVDRERSLREILAAYDAIEEQAVRSLGEESNPQRVVDVRRELAVLRLTTVKQRRGDALQAQDLFGKCERLGYSSEDARLIATSIFAQICLADGHPDLALGDLENALRAVPPGKYPRVEEVARELRAAKQ
jgi:hypothetical protein